VYEHLKTEIFRHLTLFGLLILLGWLTGQWLLVSVVLFLGYSFWHLRQIYYFERWILGFDKDAVTHLTGIWRYAIENISRYQKTGKKRKRRIARLLQRFNKTLETLPDAIVVMDGNKKIEWVNVAAKRLLGISRKHNGMKITQVIQDKSFQEFLKNDDSMLSLEMSSPVNKLIELEINLTRYDEGQFLLAAHDISDVKKVESIRREFLANVSHELRTPLTVVSGYLEMLENEELPQAIKAGITASNRQAQRMQHLVSDLLMLSKIELHTDNAPLDDIVNIPLMLAGLQSDAVRLSDTAQHKIELQCDRRLGMRGSEAELSSAFGNLIFNAVLHTPESTKIIIRWQRTAKSLEFSVKDNGPGIEAKHLAHLTERFYRVDKGRSRERGGTGLGLSIVRHVVQRHLGEVKIVSEVGKGTTFSCEFPLHRAEELQIN
jgi:two-component system phosphate regulon sensor histidine kinase PhoR